jgi:hypothetical protein
MHADFQELLALRDGTQVDAPVWQHVAGCAHCKLELTRLATLQQELHHLPPFEPPARAWPIIRDQVERLPQRRLGVHLAFSSAAAAASLVAALTLLWLVHREHETRGSDSIQSLVSRSQELEAVLQTFPPRPTVERANTSATIDDLQTRIQMLDQQLSAVPRDDRDRAQRLWSARVELMNSLVYVRYAEAARNEPKSDSAAATGAI